MAKQWSSGVREGGCISLSLSRSLFLYVIIWYHMYILYIYFRSTSYFQTASSWRFPKMVRSKGIGPVVSLMSHLVEWEYLVVNPIYPGYPWMESGWVLHGPPKFSSPCKDHRTSSWIITCVKGTLPFQRCAKGSSSWCTCKLICMLESISFFLSFFSFWFVSFSISLSLSSLVNVKANVISWNC